MFKFYSKEHINFLTFLLQVQVASHFGALNFICHLSLLLLKFNGNLLRIAFENEKCSDFTLWMYKETVKISDVW